MGEIAMFVVTIAHAFTSVAVKNQKATSLNQQFINRLTDGLNCSPFEAKAILDTVYEVFSPYMEPDKQQGLGQIHMLCTGIENSSSKSLNQAQMVR